MNDGSLLDRLKARRDERLADNVLYLPVPEWGGTMIGCFRPVSDPDELKRLGALKGVEGAAELLATACCGILLRDDEHPDRFEHLTDEHDLPVTFGEVLADKLGIDAREPLAVLRHLVSDGSSDGNEAAIVTYAAKVDAWMLDTSRIVEGQLAGEALAGARSARSPQPDTSTS